MPKINWRQLLKVAKTVGQMFLPEAVGRAIDQVEDHVDTVREGGIREGWSGPEKREAALGILLEGLAAAEGMSQKDLFNDPMVAAAGRKVIDATHASKVAAAEFAEAIALFKGARNNTPTS